MLRYNITAFLLLGCLNGSCAVEFSQLAEKEPLVLSLAEQLSIIAGKDWTKASLEPSRAQKGRKLSGYIKVDKQTYQFKKTKNGEVSAIELASYSFVDYGRVSSRALKAGDKYLDKWLFSEALSAYEHAVKESKNHPAAVLALRRAQAIHDSYNAIRNQLVPSKENAKAATYIDTLTLLVDTLKLKSVDEELGKGIKLAWHEQVAGLSDEQRSAFQTLAKRVKINLSWSPEAGSWLQQARDLMKQGDAKGAAGLYTQAYEGHASFTDNDYIGMAKALLAKGDKKGAASFLKELPLQVRRRPDVDPLMEQAGVPRTYGTFSFRGNGTGVFPEAIPVTSWSRGGKNWVWSLKMGKSNASPVINGNKVLCMDEPNFLVCVDAKSGKELWRRSNSLADAGQAGAKPHSPDWISTYGWTCMTPVTEGNRVWVALGNGVVASYDLQGNRKWIKTVPVSGKLHGCAASPCIIDGYLVTYTAKGSGGSYFGFDADSGQQLWSDRCAITQGGLIPFKMGGKPYVLSSGGVLYNAANGSRVWDHKQCFAAKDGQERGNNWGATVVIDKDVAYFNNHYDNTKSTGMLAIKLSGSSPEELWWQPTGGRIGASHIVHDGLIYAARGQCLDQKTGKKIYDNGGPGASYSSLVLAGDHIYQFGKKKVTIFKTGKSYARVAEFEHGFRDFIASAVFDGPRFYFRDGTGLHCIGR